jgi:hypothetical protein
MLTISLKEFILTGKFGPVETGMTMEQVTTLLGIPDAVQEYQVSTAFSYGRYEFFFDPEKENMLYAIQNDHLMHTAAYSQETGFENSRFFIDTWILQQGKNITKKQIIALLGEAHISFSYEMMAGMEILKLQSGVTLDFDLAREQDTEEVLNGIRYFPDFVLPG